MKVVFGIDLGTTNSAISYFDVQKQKIEEITIDTDHFMPSVVHYPTDSSQPIQCGIAATSVTKNIQNTIQESKRYIGRKVSQEELLLDVSATTNIILSDEGEVLYQITQDKTTKQISPVEVASEILKYLKTAALKRLGFGCDP
ncbi:heat shock protein, putative, partial [Entamoeba invadens IP1]